MLIDRKKRDKINERQFCCMRAHFCYTVHSDEIANYCIEKIETLNNQMKSWHKLNSEQLLINIWIKKVCKSIKSKLDKNAKDDVIDNAIKNQFCHNIFKNERVNLDKRVTICKIYHVY